jgi:hypothetical protein
MSTQSASNRVDIVTTQSGSFERFAGLSAILAGIAGLLYSISFVLLNNDLLIISRSADYSRSKESYSFDGCAVERVYR